MPIKKNWMTMKTWVPLVASLLCAILFIACTPQRAAEPAAAGEPPPDEEPLDMDDPLVQDAQGYAEQFDLPLEEAVQRLRVQGQLGDLDARLQQNESDTFAGMWLEHEPQFRIVLAFTEGGEEVAARYVEGQPYAEYVEVETRRFTYAQLKQAQQEATSIMEQLNVGGASGIDVTENVVSLSVGNPDLFLEELRAAGLQLPEAVRVEATDPDHLTDTLRGGVEIYDGPQGQTIYFPRQAPSGGSMEALIEGMLILDENGCLRIEAEHDEGRSPLVVWPAGFELEVEGDAITILNQQSEIVGRVGEPIRMGGGHIETVTIPDMPDEACPGPYWLAGASG